MIEQRVGEFSRRVVFQAAYDKRSKDPRKDYGVGQVYIHFSLVGPVGAISVVISTGWYLPHVARKQVRSNIEWMQKWGHPLDRVGQYGVHFHYPNPQYEDHSQSDCDLLPGGKCYGNGRFADDSYLNILLAEGDDAVWKKLEEEYREEFPGLTP